MGVGMNYVFMDFFVGEYISILDDTPRVAAENYVQIAFFFGYVFYKIDKLVASLMVISDIRNKIYKAT
jgi:hypothetical protein